MSLSLVVLLAVAAGGEGDTAPRGELLPQRVDLSARLDELGLSARSQGSRNTCSLFAIAALASFENARGGPSPAPRLSPELLTWAANEATGLSGDQAMFYEAVHGLSSFGICTEQLMPYQGRREGSGRPSPEALAEARSLSGRWRIHWIKRWDVKTPLSDAQLLEIKRALAGGHLVAGGLRWPKRLKGASILEVPPPEGVYDGHSIAFTGYRDEPGSPGGGEITFRNSAGRKWGDDGDGVLSYGYLRAYLNDALWLELGPPGSEQPTERVEAESLTVVAQERCRSSSQSMKPWGAGLWSGGTQLHCGADAGGFVELGFEVAKQGRYRLRLLATTAPNFGIVEAALDGQTLQPRIDLYSGRVSPTGALELGTLPLRGGSHRLRVTSAGKNAAAAGFGFGLDALEWLEE